MAAARTAKTKLAGPPDSGEFVYTAPGGGTITLPMMATALDPAELRQVRKQSELGIFYYIIERDYNEEQLAEIDKVLATMSITEDVPDMIRQWQEHSRVTLGESSASSTSPGDTGKR